MKKYFVGSLFVFLILAQNASAQYTFTKVADIVNTGSVPQNRPFLNNGDVIFNGFAPAAVFRVPPSGDPFLFMVPGTEIPGVQGGVFNHVALLVMEDGIPAFAGFNANNNQGWYLSTPDAVVPLAGMGTPLEQPSFVAVSQGNAAFVTGQFAVGAFTAVNAYRDGVIAQIAERGTRIPGGGGERFHRFTTVDIYGDLVLFPAEGDAGTQGIYYQEGAGQPIKVFVDTTQMAPGGNANYMTLIDVGAPRVDGTNVVFFAEMVGGREALFYSEDMGTPAILAEKEAGSGTTLPDGTERVDRISALSIDGDRVAFIAFDENETRNALFVAENNVVTRVIGTGDQVGSRTMGKLGGSPGMLEGDTLTFGVEIGISANEIYRSEINPGLEPTGTISNGSFTEGLDGWTPSGMVEVAPNPAADLTSDTEPSVGTAEIAQAISTAADVFWIFFDSRFTTAAGSIDVLIDGKVVATIPAPAEVLPAFTRNEIKIDDPSLFGLNDVDLTFRLNPGSESNVLLTSIYSPVDGSVSGGDFAINAGHSGGWFNRDTSGQGFFIDVVPALDFIFMSWFTYTDSASANPNEQQWYTLQGSYVGSAAELPIFETLGGQFDDPQAPNTVQVGTAMLSFSNCDNGEIAYNFDDGRQGVIPIERVIPGSGNVCGGLANPSLQAVDVNAGMDGGWFEPATSGQGVFFDVHPNEQGGGFFFGAWFTYGNNTASGQAWYTFQGGYNPGSMVDIDLFETTGGSFDDPQAVNTVKVGTVSIDFEDCDNATLNYAFDAGGPASDIAMTRVVPGGEDLCNTLTEDP